MTNECVNCGSTPTIWLGGHQPRCANCPPEECIKCGTPIETGGDPWEWEEYCDACGREESAADGEVWCTECGERPTLVRIGWEGPDLRCACGHSASIQNDRIVRLPDAWKYKTIRGFIRDHTTTC